MVCKAIGKVGLQVWDDIALDAIYDHFDWSPFFWTWELRGKFPKILESSKYGEQAREIYEEAQRLVEDLIKNKRMRCRAAFGLWPANRVGDDVELYTDESRSEVLETFHFLRQQMEKDNDQPYYSLADFVAPKESGRIDYLGAFAVTSGFEIEEYAESYKKNGDDYTSIMLQALGDRFAEALAEYLHKEVRKLWGYGSDEGLTVEDLIEEKYRGIRPAAGYPACPDHTEKGPLWDLLNAEENTTIKLTESYAMTPAASVSGLYFAHPESRYFRVGKIGHDQVEDYAARKGMSVEEVEKWLRPNLGYDETAAAQTVAAAS